MNTTEWICLTTVLFFLGFALGALCDTIVWNSKVQRMLKDTKE